MLSFPLLIHPLITSPSIPLGPSGWLQYLPKSFCHPCEVAKRCTSRCWHALKHRKSSHSDIEDCCQSEHRIVWRSVNLSAFDATLSFSPFFSCCRFNPFVLYKSWIAYLFPHRLVMLPQTYPWLPPLLLLQLKWPLAMTRNLKKPSMRWEIRTIEIFWWQYSLHLFHLQWTPDLAAGKVVTQLSFSGRSIFALTTAKSHSLLDSFLINSFYPPLYLLSPPLTSAFSSFNQHPFLLVCTLLLLPSLTSFFHFSTRHFYVSLF